MAEVEKRDDQSHPGENYRMGGIVYPAKLVREIREGRDEESNRNLAGNTFTVTVTEDVDDGGEEEEGKKKKKKKKVWRTETLTLDDYLTLCVKYFIPRAEEVIARDEMEEKLEKLTLSSGESVPSSSDEMEV